MNSPDRKTYELARQIAKRKGVIDAAMFVGMLKISYSKASDMLCLLIQNEQVHPTAIHGQYSRMKEKENGNN